MKRPSGSLALVGALFLGVASTGAHAATLTVTTLRDSGRGSLRQAIERANRTTSADTIVFAARVRGTLGLKSSLPNLKGSLSIIGPGRERLNVRRTGMARYRIFTITKDAHVSLAGLTLSNGFAQSLNKDDEKGGVGGGISNEGRLRMNACSLTGNQSSGSGGALFNAGAQLTLTNCSVTDNTCLLTDTRYDFPQGGGGLCNTQSDTPLLISDCTFSGNACRGDGSGGAINNASGATMRILRSTLTHNNARGGGAYSGVSDVAGEYGGQLVVMQSLIANNTAIYDGAIGMASYGGKATLTNCTLSGNKATDPTDGVGAIWTGLGGVTLTNCTIVGNVGSKCGGVWTSPYSSISECIIAGNVLPSHAPGNDIFFGEPQSATRPHLSQGRNLIGRGEAATLAYFDQPDDHCKVSLAALKLGPLADNGGPTKTYALLPGSVAIGQGGAFAAKANIATDQRGGRRSQGQGDKRSIGAFQTASKTSAKTEK